MSLIMRKIFYYIVFTFIFFISIVTVQAQSRDEKKGNNYFKKGEWYLAMEEYLEAIENGEQLSDDGKKNLGYCYYQRNNMEKAYEFYSELEDKLSGEDILTYAKVLHKFGLYGEDGGAIEWYRKALKSGANPIEVNALIQSCVWAEKNQTFRQYLVNPSNLLSPGVSFGIQYYKDGVVYSYAGKNSKNVDKLGNAFQNLFYAPLEDNDIDVENVKNFSSNLRTPYHIGAVSFTSDNKTMYFTKSVRVKGGQSRIKIYRVTWDGKDWVDETELPFMKKEFDYAYPALSPDDNFLYFTSNEEGGYGGKDLYRVQLIRGGKYGTVSNLGSEVNTYGDEEFPFISKDNTLYFASDGHIGYGGLDLFKAEMVNNVWINVQNMLLPFNSAQDDFALVLDPNNENLGFLSSTRRNNVDNFFTIKKIEPKKEEPKVPEPKVGDTIDITKLPEEKPEPLVEKVPEPVVSKYPELFNAKVKSTFNNEPAAGVKAQIFDVNTGKLIVEGVSNADGKYNINIPDEYRKDGQDFELVFSKDGAFNSKRMIINIDELSDVNSNGLSLTPIFNDEVLDDISGMVLYYEGMELTEESKKTLDRLAVYLQKNPQLVVKLNSHTDARGNKLDNLMNSQRMGENVENMLMKKGVDDDNLIPRGYGERYIVNKCKRGVFCDNKEQLKNRRIEVVVWRVKGQ